MATTRLEEMVTPELIVLCQIIKTTDSSFRRKPVYFSKLRELLKHLLSEQDLSNAMDILYDHEIVTCEWKQISESGEIRWVRAYNINKEAEHRSRKIYEKIGSELPLR